MSLRSLTVEQRWFAFVLGCVALGIGAALFYFGGGEFIRGEPWVPLDGAFRGNGWVLGAGCAAISVNGDWYGIRIVPRFFDSPLLQCVMIGASVGGILSFLTMMRNALLGLETVDEKDD